MSAAQPTIAELARAIDPSQPAPFIGQLFGYDTFREFAEAMMKPNPLLMSIPWKECDGWPERDRLPTTTTEDC